MRSLRQRAILAGLASGFVSVGVGVAALYSYVDSKVLDRFDRTLMDRHTQLIVALSVATEDPDQLRDLLFDPSYGTPFSGRYWQVTGSDGQIYTSASLFDQTFLEPDASAEGTTIWNTRGPEAEGIRGAYQLVSFEDGSEWGVSVAENLTELESERRDTRRNLILTFALVAAIGVAGSLFLVSAVLVPLRKLREDVAKRWDEDERLNPEEYPEEVAPLVGDINELLHRNREIVAGSRRQTADLAHALKTPVAILRNEVTALTESGVATDKVDEALSRIDAQLARSLARMRAANTAELAHARTDLSNSVDRFSRLFSSLAEREGKSFEAANSEGLWVRMDAQDIEEVIGNLLDNALKWSKTIIRLTATKADNDIEILIEDDGPGIPELSRREALRSGGRLDTSQPGTGLGLAIATDLLKAYSADLEFGTSADLGGLVAKVTIPAQTHSGSS